MACRSCAWARSSASPARGRGQVGEQLRASPARPWRQARGCDAAMAREVRSSSDGRSVHTALAVSSPTRSATVSASSWRSSVRSRQCERGPCRQKLDVGRHFRRRARAATEGRRRDRANGRHRHSRCARGPPSRGARVECGSGSARARRVYVTATRLERDSLAAGAGDGAQHQSSGGVLPLPALAPTTVRPLIEDLQFLPQRLPERSTGSSIRRAACNALGRSRSFTFQWSSRKILAPVFGRGHAPLRSSVSGARSCSNARPACRVQVPPVDERAPGTACPS
jgi:hypothetical protein